MRTVFLNTLLIGSLWSALALAGGSNYGITPGGLPQIAGNVSEWPVPTPNFARDPAPGPDGNIYIAVMNGNKIARFDTGTQKFNEWDLPKGARPHGPRVLVPKAVHGEYGGGTLAAALLALAGADFGFPPACDRPDPALGIVPAHGCIAARRVLLSAIAAGGVAAWSILDQP